MNINSQWKPEVNTLDLPSRWRGTHHCEVTSDLFHELVPDEFIRRVWRVMLNTPQHTYQILTKRPERMADWVEENVYGPAEYGDWTLTGLGGGVVPNVWLGVSVENQGAADERIPHLLKTPAAIRFLSCEPLLGPVDLMKHYPSLDSPSFSTIALSSTLLGGQRVQLVDWVIAGGESGPGHRAMNLGWIRSLKEQCAAAGVPFWAKQDSAPRPEAPLPEDLRIREMPRMEGSEAKGGSQM